MKRLEDGRVLVTGAAGFVGSAVVGLLRAKGLEVVAHARRPAPHIGWVADLADLAVTHPVLPDKTVAVVHCAAAIPTRSQSFARDNAAATAELAALLASSRSLKRVVHLSSVSVYKRPPSGRWLISEDAMLLDVADPASDPYGASKVASEFALDALVQRRPELKVTHLRASSIYGPGMVLTTLLPTFIANARRGRALGLRGPRNFVQNFVHVDDVADLVAALIFDELAPRAMNAFSDDTLGLLALGDLVKTVLRSRSEIVDDTADTEIPAPVFVNASAKRLLPRFRRLADHLLDAV